MGNNAKENLYIYIDNLRKRYEFGFVSGKPVCLPDFFGNRNGIDIIYHDFDTNGFCGAAYAGPVSDTMVLNENRSLVERNFDCTHEVIHLTKHRSLNNGIFKCFDEAQNSFLEWEANEGAAQLLVPYQDFIPRFSACLDSHHTSGTIQSELATHYFVSTQVINIRIESLSYEIDQYRNGVPIEKIELLSRRQRLARGIKSTDYSALCDFALDWDSVIG